MAAIPTATLNDGSKIPVTGFGTGTAWFKTDKSAPVSREAVDAIKNAMSAGYYHLDGAEMYNTEPELGIAIKESGVPREKLFITTKVLETIDNIPLAIDQSLKKLQLDYVDLYLIHSPYFGGRTDADLQKAWKDMEEVLRSGKAKAIGVSNFLRPHIEAILKTATVKPVINQIEFHPYLQRANGYVPWLQSQGIAVSSFFGLVPLTYGKGGPLDNVLADIAKKHDVNENAVLTRWQLNQNVIVITTTKKKERLGQYLVALNLKLSDAEQEEITKVGLTHHFRVVQDNFSPTDGS